MNTTLLTQLRTLRDNLSGSSIFPIACGQSFYHGGRHLSHLNHDHPLWATITPAGANLHVMNKSAFTTVTRVATRRDMRLLDIGANTLKTAYESLELESLSDYEKLLTHYCELIKIDGILCRGENIFFAHQDDLTILN
jgi:hypothetical protein